MRARQVRSDVNCPLTPPRVPMQPAAFLLLADKSARMKRAAAAELPGISFSFFFLFPRETKRASSQ